MELVVYQQCMIIVFFLSTCHTKTTKAKDVMECEIGNVLVTEDAAVECYHAKVVSNAVSCGHAKFKKLLPPPVGGDGFDGCWVNFDLRYVAAINKDLTNKPGTDPSCLLVTCGSDQQVLWKVLDERHGKIEVHLYGVPKTCNFEFYDMNLEVFESSDALNMSQGCDVGSNLWYTHSKRSLKNEDCSDCPDDSTDCLQMYTLVFKYIYPGWYRLKVTPRISDGSTRQSQVSSPFLVDHSVSKYVKKRLVDLNVNISLQYRDSIRQLDVGIPLLVDVPPEVVAFKVKYSAEYIDLYRVTRYGNDNESNVDCLLVGSLSKPICQSTSALIECTFSNMTDGDYRIVVRFRDDRCTMSTIWTDPILDSQDPCRWDITREYNYQPAPKETLIDNSRTEILYSAVALSALIFVLLIAFFVNKRRSSRRRLLNQTEGGSPREQHYYFNSQVNRFNFGHLLTLTDKPRPEVLLIYTKESPPFMELVACLRRVLDRVGKCQVYDYFDPDMWNEISQDPEGWLHTLIIERQAKVVIVATEAAAIRHRSLIADHSEMAYNSPHPFDNLFLYALKLLRDGMDEDSYKKYFVIMFDGFAETKYALDFFNPYTRFILPKHLGKLFQHIHDSNSIAPTVTTNRLEEKYEVRQLRLQLEHLINLKLLNQNGTEKQKLYEW